MGHEKKKEIIDKLPLKLVSRHDFPSQSSLCVSLSPHLQIPLLHPPYPSTPCLVVLVAHNIDYHIDPLGVCPFTTYVFPSAYV